MSGTTLVLFVVALQLLSPALCQSNERPIFDDDSLDISVFENHNVFNPVTETLKATDFDGDAIEYYIPATGLGSNYFTVETVNISTEYYAYLYFKPEVNLDRENVPEYRVIVYTTDNQDHGNSNDDEIEVIVTLVDINDEYPEFTNLPKTEEFAEDTNLYVVLYQAQASDADSGKNAQIRYSISGVNPALGESKFDIYVSSGEIFLTEFLDYETVTEYFITVYATDRGDSPLSSAAIFTVKVLDVNDNPPVFSQVEYDGQINENATQGTYILSVSAEDQDRMIDDDMVYSFSSTIPEVDGDPIFVINNVTGEIFVNAKLDIDSGDETYTLTVKAEEASDPDKFATAPVVITLVDVNDNPPVFEEPAYNTTISELSSIGTTVLTVRASDMDMGPNAEFVFELVNLLSSPLPFNVTPSGDGESGHIQLFGTLDFEAYEFYKFEVRAVEVVNEKKKTATTTVTVNILNDNDNDPEFDESEFFGSVSENAKPGALVIQVNADDDDKGTFGDVYYYLINDFGTFRIDEDFGIITTTTYIDYELIQSYSLTVVANDSAVPSSQQRSQKVLVHISVLDENDNGPVIFVNGSDSIIKVDRSVEEEQEPGVLIFVIDAEDDDEPPHNELDYFIQVIEPEYLTEKHFEFSDTARNQLVTKEPLDYEKINRYTLRLFVTDLGDKIMEIDGSASGSSINDIFYESVTDLPTDHVDFIDVVVYVLDENDNAPLFVDGITGYSFDVVEEQPVNTTVGFANATDADSGLFGTVRYSLSGVDHQNFTVDDVSGEIFTAGPINREEKDRFDLIVTARDLDTVNTLSSTATLTLTITDINDNNPIFSQPIYYDNDIVENTLEISIPVSADDLDIDENDDLMYEIIDGNSGYQFVIDSDTGIISRNVTVTLDREIYPEFHLIIEATDNGEPQRSSNATVIIVLQDMDDNDPLFEQGLYELNITEDTTIGTPIITVKANDPDDGPNGKVRYSLSSGATNVFEIDVNEGTVTTTSDFDYDTGLKEYSVEVKAEDNGPLGDPNYATIEIIIVDVNDNSPIFVNTPYTASVSENVDGDYSIMKVRATDADDGSNKKIKYIITDVTIVGVSVPTDVGADNTNGLFYIDSDSGELFLASTRELDYESVKSYNIYVQASDRGDPIMNTTSVVSITITDFNDNRPILSAESYALTFTENTPVDTIRNIFSYQDADSGDNAVVTYSIEGTSVFSIDDDTGILTLESSLNYEETSYFEFTVIIKDGGSPTLNDTAQVNITVTDVNDNPPLFIDPPAPYDFDISLYEDNYTAPWNMLLYTFNATDEDDDDFGSVTYAITGGNKVLFTLNESSGELTVIGNIDREDEDEYELTITASDGGSPSRTAVVTLNIIVLDINEEPPIFLDSEYSRTIPESTSSGFTLVTVEAEDNDFGENGTVYYSLTDESQLNIDNDGVITTKVEFDYEMIDTLTVYVIASDGGGLLSSVKFTLFITDVNDNAPKFEGSYGPYEVSEGQTLGYELEITMATDIDSGANGDITYVLSGAQGKFSIDTNGRITLQSSLDREVTPYYMLVVTARDHGQPSEQSSASLNVTVTDINDNAAVFDANFYSVEVREDTGLGEVIQIVNASDADLNENQELTFKITSGNTNNAFNITTVYDGNLCMYKGIVRVNEKLDYEVLASYVLAIEAEDMGSDVMTSTAHIVITITNINDNFPTFSPDDSYTFSISEISPVGTPVGTIIASDDDIGTFGKISSFDFGTNTPADVIGNFSISSSTGVISLSNVSQLDFEYKNVYSFNVIATDGGGLQSTASVVVNVLGYNEDAPEFDADSYSGSVKENLPSDQFIVTVHASDNDGGTITYSIISGDMGRFKIDSTSGYIETTEALNREEQETYVLRIRATDVGDISLSSFVQVEVTVLDENDNAPKFPTNIADYVYVESTPVNTMLLPVRIADDADKGDNALITYSLTGEGVPDVFSVNSSNGEIKLESELNYEIKNTYTLLLVAVDGGTPSMSGNITIEFEVLDFNDNSPVFDKSNYPVTLDEDFTSGDVVIQVRANDSDSGVNAEIDYSITVEDVLNSPFQINSVGEITTTANLDYESMSSYTITVTATDRGTPERSVDVTVEVTLNDVNDNGPLFSEASFTYSVDEQDVATNISLLTIAASDSDGTSPNNMLIYNITGGNDDGKFTIDNTNGKLYAVRDLDYEESVQYVLTVLAMDNPDNADDTLSNTTQVTINIVDVNDNSPVWKDTPNQIAPNQYNGFISEAAQANTEVLVVLAEDEDSGEFGTVTYDFLTPSDKFYVNETSGIVYTHGDLDSDLISLYNLTIVARDGGSRSTIAYVTIEIGDINDKVPNFLSSFFYESISEGVSEGYVLIILDAIDFDSTDLEYSITGGNELGYFKINSTSGEVSVATSLDRETEDNFILTAFVSDGIFNDTTNLQVMITDINDNPPRFSDSHYYTYINENTVSGPVLLYNDMGNTTRIVAIDIDEADTPNSLVVYKTSGPNMDILNIDPSTAILTVASGADLDYETDQVVDVTIIAQDSVDAPGMMSSDVIITINVLDVNDKEPTFLKTGYSKSLFEDEDLNTIVFDEIEAEDVDTGLGGIVTYSITNSDPPASPPQFMIDETSGNITLIRSLDREETSQIILTIRAMDSDSPYHSSEVQLTISVKDVNDNPPVFNQTHYFVSVPEDLSVTGYVAEVFASDIDQNLNKKIDYSLLTMTDIFSINEGNGVISTKVKLDHETENYIEVVVEACDNGDVMMCSNATVIVNVTDVNDGTPTFDYDMYRTTVCDDISPVSAVLHVVAIDTDSGENGEVTYSLADGDTLGDLFELDTNSGKISLVNSISASDVDTFISFTLEAKDNGDPFMEGSTNIQISICDKDAASISFSRSYYIGAVAENEAVPANVTTVTANSASPPITYSIIPPKGDSLFNISSTTGVIQTLEMLDREERSIYTLLVQAVDSASTPNTAYATITVTVLDVNDNPPQFLLAPYFFTLTEEQEDTVIVNQIVAIDPDQPLASSGVSYSLDPLSNPDGVFNIENGTITATKPVDREMVDIYKLKIKATDLDITDSRITITTATITIEDINDNPPVFENNTYYTTIAENTPPNLSIEQVKAFDEDINENAQIDYSIVSGADDKFFIDSNSGIINTVNQLDYETKNYYNITVRARDNGVTRLSSYANVLITLEDFNDCTPQFTESQYSTSFDEDINIGEVIFDVNVTDCDSGDNQKVSFSIVAGNDNNKFHLHETTGVLTVKNYLDFEKESSYIIQIRAIDGGVPARSNFTQLLIGVNDVNDETPKFNNPSGYVLDIPEGQSVGFEILLVTAMDDDKSAINSVLQFVFLSGNEADDFILDATTGSITIKNELDRETTDRYFMVIEVSDTGTPKRTANTTLEIIITDINDNYPIFQDPPPVGVMVYIPENTSSVDVIYVVNATDEDIGNNGYLTYSLQNYESVFSIHQTNGEVKRIADIDFEQIKDYELSILVTDQGADELTDLAKLSIIITDINDNDPVFTMDEYIATQAEETDPDVIVTVQANDDDDTLENSRITYVIEDCTPCNGVELFKINSTSGVVTNTKKLDREETDMYIVTVLAINYGADPERNDTAQIRITLSDINDHMPMFNQSSYSTSISEGIVESTPILTVYATDEDKEGINSKVSYKIVSVISRNPFALDAESGQLTVTSSLDREETPSYEFIVSAEDGGAVKLSSEVQITVTLLDENDKPPVFVEKTQSVRVNEGTSNFPFYLWTLNYDDDDLDAKNKHSVYELLRITNGSTSIDLSLIMLNTTSGEIWLNDALDFETTKTLTVTLSVNNTEIGVGDLCGGFDEECYLSDIATLTIVVSDFNDNTPVFERSSYTGQVSTESDPGTQLLQVIATDRDTQNNYGEVRYSLSDDSSTKFRIESETGWVITQGTFENDDGETFYLQVEAYDNLGVDPSRTATVRMEILALNNFKRVLILFNLPLANFTEEKIQFIVDTLQNLTGYNIILEVVREHLLDDSGDVDTRKTDFIFHAVNPNTGEIVEFDTFIDNLDVELFFDIIDACNPEKISSIQIEEDYPPFELIMIFLIVLCGIIAIGAIIVLVLACQQRYIAINSLWKDKMLGAFYGTADPSIIEGAMPRDFSGETFEMKGMMHTTQSPLYVEPYANWGALETSGGSSVGEVSSMHQENPLYEEQELRMEMFEPSDDETEGDVDEANLLAAALKDDDDDLIGSVTAI